ncbi:MAG: tetratricopeptide repeat protein, partial [Treponema sp.]|nr:tetratricopeptide repeat protein [Treponema sp.]
MNKRVVIGIAVGLLLLGGTGILVFSRRGGEGAGDRTAEIRRDTLLQLARDYMAGGSYQQALDILDRVLAGDPGNTEALTLREEALRGLGSAEFAAESPPEAAPDGAAPDLTAADQAAADAERLRREAEAAARAEEKAERLAAAEAEAARRKAQEEELARQSAELRMAMQAVNDLVSQGQASLRRGDFAGADGAFADALERMPPGEPRFASLKLADMAEAYYNAHGAFPDNPGAGEAPDKAAANADRAIQLDPSLALPHYTLGKLSRDRARQEKDRTTAARQWDAAIAEFREASRLDPKDYSYSFDLGRAYFSIRRFVDARQSFEAALRLKPDSESAWYNLGGSLRAIGR